MEKSRTNAGLGEDEAFEIALNDHPDWRDKLLAGTLPDEVVDEHGNLMNPRLHLQMHAVVERQLAQDSPQGIREVAQELRSLGVSDHDIRHYLAQPIVHQMWSVLREERPYNEADHLRELREIVDSLR